MPSPAILPEFYLGCLNISHFRSFEEQFHNFSNSNPTTEQKTDLIKFIENKAYILNNPHAFQILEIKPIRYDPLLDLKQHIVKSAQSLMNNTEEFNSYFDCLSRIVGIDINTDRDLS